MKRNKAKLPNVPNPTNIGNLPKVGGFNLLPPAKDVCQKCAVKHEEWQAHNQQGLYWQYWFYSQYGRWPTWGDAIKHCPNDIKEQWVSALSAKGIAV